MPHGGDAKTVAERCPPPPPPNKHTCTPLSTGHLKIRPIVNAGTLLTRVYMIRHAMRFLLSNQPSHLALPDGR